jgi:hypothetical protein
MKQMKQIKQTAKRRVTSLLPSLVGRGWGRGWLLIFCLSCLPSFAQIKELNLQGGDSLILHISGYTQGAIQWQRTTDLTKSWANIKTESPDPSVLRYRPSSPNYFRTRVTEEGCDPYYTDTLQVNFIQQWSGKDAKLNGGRGYIVPFVSTDKGLSMSESGNLTEWTNPQRKAVWYLYQPAGKYDFGFGWNLTLRQTRDFKITCTPAYDGLDFEPVTAEFSYEGKGKRDTTFVLSVEMPKTGYYRYEMESKTVNGSITIYDLVLKGLSVPGSSTTTAAPHTTDYLSSPSVHLHYSSPNSNENGNYYDWVYQEVLVPEGFSPTATYWESIGFSGGYLGLQNNSDTERRILFSVWDQIDADAYNREGKPLPADSLVSLVDKGDAIQANGFGNEGTGGQSYFRHEKTWKEGIPVKFLFNVRKDSADCKTCPSGRKPTVVLSAFFQAYEPGVDVENLPDSLKGWRYVASWRRPFVSSYQAGTGSFIENFGWSNGHLPRKGYYYNTYNRNATTGQWLHFNQNYGTHTDGAVGQRIDYEYGVSTDPGHEDKFYMLSGGYGNTKVPTPNSFSTPRVPIEEFPYLRDLDMTPFIQRVDEAIAREKAKEDFLKSAKDKTDWTIAYYSSQEPNDGGVARPASNIIDSDATTYWHSKWMDGGSSLPHILIIDMQKTENIEALGFTLNGGLQYQIKGLQIGVSDTFSGAATGTNAAATDDANWTNIWSGDAPASNEYNIFLDAPASGRYLRLKIINGHDYDPHTRINEVDVFGDDTE